MPEHVLHRFMFEPKAGHRYWVALHGEQMEAVLCGERRVVEGASRRTPWGSNPSWWYFNDVGIGLLRVEAGPDAENTTTLWEGRVHDAYRGHLCSVLLL